MPGNTSEQVEVADTKDCDVLVIGAGVSGANTAIRAGELGKKVILVEKTDTIGGASNLSSGPIGYNSRIALDAGEQTDILPLLNDWIAGSHYRVDAASVKQLLEKSGEAIDWMSDNGWEFTPWFSASMVKFPDYSVREQLFLDALDRTVVANGGEVLTGTCAKRLVVDDEGKVTGAVVVDAEGKGLQINAAATVIATGGYGGNLDMVERVFRFRGVLGGLPQNIGEGLEMAWRAGAQKPQNFGGQMLHQTLARANDPLAEQFDAFPAKYPMILCYVAKLMNVSATGARFRNEENALSAVAAANTSAYQGSFHYVVVSKGIMDTLEQEGLAGLGIEKSPGLPPRYKPEFELDTPWENITGVFDAMVEAGAGYKGDTPRSSPWLPGWTSTSSRASSRPTRAIVPRESTSSSARPQTTSSPTARARTTSSSRKKTTSARGAVCSPTPTTRSSTGTACPSRACTPWATRQARASSTTPT